MAWVGCSFVNYKKGYTRFTAPSDKVYQLLAHGWWFSPGTPASSTTKTGRHDSVFIRSREPAHFTGYEFSKHGLNVQKLIELTFLF
jgi:hypothetical protein